MDPIIKILVCCHKQDIHADMPPYFPIHVGKALSNVQLDMTCDNQGEDNISFKNPSYCELTGMYWAWKNLKDVDIIGLCHYRRYFDFHGACGKIAPMKNFRAEQFTECDLSIPEDIIQRINNGEIVVAKPLHYMHNLATDYSICHISDDFRQMRQIFKDTQSPEYIKAFYHVMYHRNFLTPCNMFIMKWEDFDRYCNWIFSLLGQLERQIDISHYRPYQKRIFGFMAERLFNVWLYATRKHLIYKPIIRISDDKNYPNWKYIVNAVRGRLALWLTYQRH